MTDDLVEKVARALWHDRWEGYGRPWELESDREQNDYRGAARSALSAIEEAGFVIVPKEPTGNMTDAGYNLDKYGDRWPVDLNEVYTAMLSARPRITGETT